MPRAAATATFALLLCLAARAGDASGVRWAPSWRAATTEAADRNVPILLVFVRQDEAGQGLEKSVLTGMEFTAASKKWVTVYCNEDDGQPVKKEGDREFSKLTPGITVDEHVAAWRELSAKFFKADDAPAPAFVWCLPSGEEFGRKEGAMTSREITSKMAEASKKAGPGLELPAYLDALDRLRAGAEADASGKMGEAVKEYSAVLKLEKTAGGTAMAKKAREELDKLDQRGRSALEPARENIAAEDYPRAKKMLKEIADTYKGLPSGKEAEKLYQEVCEKEKAKEKARIGGDGKR